MCRQTDVSQSKEIRGSARLPSQKLEARKVGTSDWDSEFSWEKPEHPASLCPPSPPTHNSSPATALRLRSALDAADDDDSSSSDQISLFFPTSTAKSMKSTKPAAGDATAASSRRSQPVRQTRTNPPRNSTTLNRTASGRDSINGGHQADQPIDIFPGITHFTDAITALPKDLVRHFTLLKEVDAKICQPEEQLFQHIHDLLEAPLPTPQSTTDNTQASSIVAAATATAAATAPSSSFARSLNRQAGSSVPPQNHSNQRGGADATMATDNVTRRIIARQAIQKMQDMLVSLEEKNHVISVANDTLKRQLNRVEEIWPHLEKEFSDEAKWGSTTHWAYPENRLNRNAQQQAHNSRREAASHLTAAAQALADEAAARSDARKQAVAAKKRQAPQQESDLDDHDKHKNDHGKKSHPKSRKAAAESPASVGLGITAPGNTPNGNPPTKRRKVDKTANGTPVVERAMATVFGKEPQKAKTASPRETPVPEAPSRKRKPLPTSSSNGGKKKNGPAGAALSPSIASSPVLSNLPDPKAPARSSPAPTSVPKATASRAKQTSVPVTTEKACPSPAAHTKSNGTALKSPFIGPVQNNIKAKEKEEVGKPKEPPPVLEPKQEALKSEPEQLPTQPRAPAPTTTATSTKASHSKEEGSSKPEEKSSKPDTPATTPSVAPTTVTTKSGRASKPSTPALSTFPETGPNHPKTRPSRNSELGSNKRSHKKGVAAHSVASQLAEEAATSSVQGDDDDNNMDEDEPTYCYCNGVSYGEMVACDSDGCEREWFHLECVGLKVAPKTNAKWYCEDCKEKMKNNGKKVNGR
ncbi:hypothetical protein MKZ38_009432 [Zalerion maritima]|uniref:Chromatin modification-related protein n=1 Tax=Zalerion maritima TaxID=339359 RepID=A0AAD5RK14_9PEZI|nr:hypothetical protein MKZ38_009432 [Zalerion maritima]